MLSTNSASGETNCSTSSGAQGVCVTKDALRAEANRVADGMCTEARADLADWKNRATFCEGRLDQTQQPHAAVPSSPWLLRFGLSVGVLAFSGSGGFCLGRDDCPTVAGGVLLGAGLVSFGARMLVEWLDDRLRKARL